MIDEVIERTDCTYKDAKEALLETDGDVIEAIILLESKTGKKQKASGTFDHVTTELVDKLKSLLEKGDVNRIAVEKNDKVVMDIPVTAGIVGAVVFAPAVITSLIVALGTGHSVKIIKENGEIIDFKEYADKTYETVKEKATQMKDKVKREGKEEDFDLDDIEVEDIDIDDIEVEDIEEEIEE